MYGNYVDSFITIELVQLREYLTLCESIILYLEIRNPLNNMNILNICE